MQLKEFMKMIAGDGTLHIRTEQPSTGEIEEFWLEPDLYDADSLQQQFSQKSLNEQRNMWFQVGTVKPNSKVSQTANVVWADADVYKYPGGELQLQGLMRRLPTPTVIVRSGRGLHFYWKLNEPVDAVGQMSQAQQLSKYVQWLLGADAAHSPSKLLRLPFTYNFKPNEYEGGKLCEILQVNDVSYDAEDFQIDEVLCRIGHKLMTKIMLGPTEAGIDRSEYDFHVAAELFKQAFSEQEVAHLLRTYPFSGKVASEPHNTENYVARTIKSALFRVQLNPTSVRKSQPAAVWEGKTLEQIKQEEKPPFIVEDFLPSAGVAMIAAPPKARKSWSVMQLAYCVATGQEWLGFAVPQPQKVLYVQAELPNWMVAERITQMYGEQTLDNVKFFHVPAANLLDDDDLTGLLDAVREFDAKLVIIDPIANFWQGDENSSSSVNQLFDQIARIQAIDAAVVMVHHTRKTDVNERLSPQHQRGSNVFFARPAAVMTLSPMLYPGEVPFTYADFALRAAATPDAFKLYTDSSGKFTKTPPTLGEPTSAVRRKLMAMKQAKDNGEDTAPWAAQNAVFLGRN